MAPAAHLLAPALRLPARAALLALAAGLTAACGGEPPILPLAMGDAEPRTQMAMGDEGRLDGTWGLKVTVPVRWPATEGVEAGTGEVVQFAKVERSGRRQAEGPATAVEVLTPCGITLPSMRQAAQVGQGQIKLVFGAAQFDDSELASVAVESLFPEGLDIGRPFSSGWAALQLGAAVPDALPRPGQPDAWPRDVRTLEAHQWQRVVGTPRVFGLVGDFAAEPPYRRPGAFCLETSQLALAIRIVERIHGTLESWDRAHGRVEVMRLEDGRWALEQLVLGAAVHGLWDATGAVRTLATEALASFEVDEERAAGASMTMVRLPAGERSCAVVRDQVAY